MSTAMELRAQIVELTRKADEQEAAERAKLFDGILEKIAKAGFTVSDLLEYASPKGKKTGMASPKFRGPLGELWSGMGRHPAWYDTAIQEGLSKDLMRIR